MDANRTCLDMMKVGRDRDSESRKKGTGLMYVVTLGNTH